MRNEHSNSLGPAERPPRTEGRRTMLALVLMLSFTIPVTLAGRGVLPQNVTLKDMKNTSVEMKDLCQDKVAVLVFWRGCCFTGKRELSDLIKVHEELNGSGLEIISINTDTTRSISAAKAYISSRRFPFRVLFDTESTLEKALNPRGIRPYTVILDKEGSIVYERAGYRSGDIKEINAKLLGLLDVSDEGASTE